MANAVTGLMARPSSPSDNGNVWKCPCRDRAGADSRCSPLPPNFFGVTGRRTSTNFFEKRRHDDAHCPTCHASPLDRRYCGDESESRAEKSRPRGPVDVPVGASGAAAGSFIPRAPKSPHYNSSGLQACPDLQTIFIRSRHRSSGNARHHHGNRPELSVAHKRLRHTAVQPAISLMAATSPDAALATNAMATLSRRRLSPPLRDI
jgi:hypothetical protein